MATGDYTKTTYVNGSAPAINATSLNNNEIKTKELDTDLASHLANQLNHVGSIIYAYKNIPGGL